MDYHLYFVIRQILMGLLLFLGVHMIFMPLPVRMRGSLYKCSLRTMGIAFLFVPLSCFIYTLENRLDFVPNIAPAINLTVYFATFVLMTIAFLTLLGRRLSRVVVGISILAIVIFPIPLWLCLIFGQAGLIDGVLTASYTFFVSIVVFLVVFVLHRYYVMKKNVENYYSEDVMICVSWVTKSIILLIGLSITCAVAPLFWSCSYWLRFVFMSYGALCYLYIYCGYQRMMLNITERLIEVNTLECIEATNDESFDGIISPEVAANIDAAVREWVQNRSYAKKGVTINDMAKSIRTNRTYLSKFINTTYGTSFKSWITKLRIDESKLLLLSAADLSITKIADFVGFASGESFTHIFTRSEGVSPTKWREINLEHNTYRDNTPK